MIGWFEAIWRALGRRAEPVDPPCPAGCGHPLSEHVDSGWGPQTVCVHALEDESAGFSGVCPCVIRYAPPAEPELIKVGVCGMCSGDVILHRGDARAKCRCGDVYIAPQLIAPHLR